jgi:hypothetical protein
MPAWLFVVALLLPGVLLVVAWGQAARPAPPPGPVEATGRAIDKSGKPIPSALVFAVSAPRRLVRTDGDGRFTLPEVPAGRQVLVVVVNDIGQEFPVRLDASAPADVGTLVYLAPPEH